jgi:hypothetical protein
MVEANRKAEAIANGHNNVFSSITDSNQLDLELAFEQRLAEGAAVYTQLKNEHHELQSQYHTLLYRASALEEINVSYRLFTSIRSTNMSAGTTAKQE